MQKHVDEIIEPEPPETDFGCSIGEMMKLKRRITQLEFIIAEMYRNIGTRDEREDYMTAEELAFIAKWDGTYPKVSFSRGYDTSAVAADLAYHGSHWE